LQTNQPQRYSNTNRGNTVPHKGVDVTVKYSVSGKAAVDGVVAGAGVMGVSGSLVSVTAATRAPVYVVAPLGRSEYLIELVTQSGINAAADLKGKRVAVQFGTEAHRFVPLYLQKHGLSGKDVTLVNIPAQALPPALSRGDVNAVAVWPPHSTKALEATTDAKLFTTSHGVSAGYGVVIMRKDFVESNPEGAGKLLRALL
jgi:NitT/TauT family transport system substrate-binding protein